MNEITPSLQGAGEHKVDEHKVDEHKVDEHDVDFDRRFDLVSRQTCVLRGVVHEGRAQCHPGCG